MANKFGGIELGGALGGYDIVNIPADKLPQDAASAIGAVNSEILGATFRPIWYVGKQVVNGVNYLFVAEQIRVTKAADKYIVGLVVDVPPGEKSLQGEGAKVVRIIESGELPAEVETAFKDAEKHLIGVSYRPVMYIGKQLVKGENHFILCEAKTIYPNAEPYAAILAINIFDGKTSVVGVLPIRDKVEGTGLFGYAFTW